MIIEIQCLPSPSGNEQDRYAHVHAAIEVIQDAGVAYEVGPLGTAVEGEPDTIWPLLRQVHEATMEAGAGQCITIVKVLEQRVGEPATMVGLTDRYRT